LPRSRTPPLILAGDFNATPHSAWHARFLRRGLRDSHDLCGRPLATTWANGVLPIPRIRLDHVLVSAHLGCAAIVEGVGEGSDHRPVVVDLQLAPGGDG
jgi:endonuclease/exonuclease/phosphatase (EEP) superfamily protein YafD